MLNKISIALLAAASVVSLCMLPRTGTDAAKLLPAQVLVIAAGGRADHRGATTAYPAPARRSRTRLASHAGRGGGHALSGHGGAYYSPAKHTIASARSGVAAAVPPGGKAVSGADGCIGCRRLRGIFAGAPRCGDACGRARRASARRSTRPGDSAAGGNGGIILAG